MKVIIFGATGMVGMGALLECLDEPRVERILVVGRRPCGVTSPKLNEIVHKDFFDYSKIRQRFAGYDACFFCLGVSAAGTSDERYHHLTYDLTIAAAGAVLSMNKRLTFCYVSGTGTDSTEQGRLMWARVKGKTENALLRMPFTAAYMLRPGLIQPMRGVRSSTPMYQGVYNVIGPLFPLIRAILPSRVTTTVNIGRALIRLAAVGDERKVLYNADLNELASRSTGG